MFGLLPVRGTFTIGQGRITVAELVEELSIQVVMEAASFGSGNQQRDEHVRSPDYLDVARHPEIDFRSQRLERSASDATLQGELTVCGVTRPVAVTLDTVLHEGKRITASGTARVDRYAFGVTKAKGMTGRHLRITLEVVANR
ncbi:YceI family protein [Streptomyces sp. Wb2n-11]|uniref:YceI family protein n=1 Tax=Streptomyces sp. Wb2n-11 TaxID=1030533 RepID=UPI002100674B|nr:YceI family protein [Streptomyces sp. Wb2n-11]